MLRHILKNSSGNIGGKIFAELPPVPTPTDFTPSKNRLFAKPCAQALQPAAGGVTVTSFTYQGRNQGPIG